MLRTTTTTRPARPTDGTMLGQLSPATGDLLLGTSFMCGELFPDFVVPEWAVLKILGPSTVADLKDGRPVCLRAVPASDTEPHIEGRTDAIDGETIHYYFHPLSTRPEWLYGHHRDACWDLWHTTLLVDTDDDILSPSLRKTFMDVDPFKFEVRPLHDYYRHFLAN